MRSSSRILLAIASLVLTLGLGACSPEDPYIPTAPPVEVKHPAYLRVVHAAAEAPAATPLIDGKTFRGSTEYLTWRAGVNEAHYYPVDTSSNRLEFLGAGSILASAGLDMKVGQYYTAYLHGRPGDYRVLVTDDSIQSPGLGMTKLRMVNLAPDAPPLDLWLSSSDRPVALNAAYGTASAYDLRSLAGVGMPAMSVVVSGTTDTIFQFPKDRFTFPANVTWTLVLTGYRRPSAEQPLVSMAAFPESAFYPDARLYGGIPIRLELAAIRFVSLISSPRAFDVSFYDEEYDRKYNHINQGFRRNYPGQDKLANVYQLGEPFSYKGYFLQTLSRTEWLYRVEEDITGDMNLDQPPATKPDSLRIEANKRYTIVAYGPAIYYSPEKPDYTRSAWLKDNVPTPSSLGMTRVRFFHGSFGPLQQEQLRLRIAGIVTRRMRYGEAPAAADAIEVASGTDMTIDILNEEDGVVHTARHSFVGGTTYTLFFYRSTDSSAARSHALSESMD